MQDAFHLTSAHSCIPVLASVPSPLILDLLISNAVPAVGLTSHFVVAEARLMFGTAATDAVRASADSPRQSQTDMHMYASPLLSKANAVLRPEFTSLLRVGIFSCRGPGQRPSSYASMVLGSVAGRRHMHFPFHQSSMPCFVLSSSLLCE